VAATVFFMQPKKWFLFVQKFILTQICLMKWQRSVVQHMMDTTAITIHGSMVTHQAGSARKRFVIADK
jgi:hypothetical protein